MPVNVQRYANTGTPRVQSMTSGPSDTLPSLPEIQAVPLFEPQYRVATPSGVASHQQAASDSRDNITPRAPSVRLHRSSPPVPARSLLSPHLRSDLALETATGVSGFDYHMGNPRRQHTPLNRIARDSPLIRDHESLDWAEHVYAATLDADDRRNVVAQGILGNSANGRRDNVTPDNGAVERMLESFGEDDNEFETSQRDGEEFLRRVGRGDVLLPHPATTANGGDHGSGTASSLADPFGQLRAGSYGLDTDPMAMWNREDIQERVRQVRQQERYNRQREQASRFRAIREDLASQRESHRETMELLDRAEERNNHFRGLFNRRAADISPVLRTQQDSPVQPPRVTYNYLTHHWGTSASDAPPNAMITVQTRPFPPSYIPLLRSNNPEQDRVCSVCLEEYKQGEDMAILPCNGLHRFHVHCINAWHNRQRNRQLSCPLCRDVLAAKQNVIVWLN